MHRPARRPEATRASVRAPERTVSRLRQGKGFCNTLGKFQQIRDQMTMRRTDPAKRAVGLSSFLRQAIDLPELNFAVFAFLLNFPWEFLQIPLYVGMADAPHWDATKVCAFATLGDAVIMVVAYWTAAVAARSRYWFLKPRQWPITVFLLAGIAITIVLERLATGPLDRWQYAAAMPVVPLLGVGLTPLLQWLVLPLICLWFVGRQIPDLQSRISKAVTD